jgi:hypothetical protein
MSFPLWSSSIQLKGICFGVFLVAGFSRIEFNFLSDYNPNFLCFPNGFRCSVNISFVMNSPLAWRLTHVLGLVILLSGFCLDIINFKLNLF